jgi:hypothetical protein
MRRARDHAPTPGEILDAAQIVTARYDRASIPALPRIHRKMRIRPMPQVATGFPRPSRNGTLAASPMCHTSWPTRMKMPAINIARASFRVGCVAMNAGPCYRIGWRTLREIVCEHEKCRKFMNAGTCRQEWSMRVRSVRQHTDKCQIQGDVQVNSATQVCAKRGCYVSKRDNCRTVRYSALKCPVFRGRSTCSPNSKHFHRISAD